MNKINNPLNNLKGNPKKGPFNLYWLYIFLFLILGSVLFLGGNASKKDIEWSSFQNYLKENKIKSIDVFTNKNTLEAVVRYDAIESIFNQPPSKVGSAPVIVVQIPSTDIAEKFFDKVKQEKGYDFDVNYSTTSLLWSIIIQSIPFIILIFLWIFFMKMMSGGAGGSAGGIFNVGKSKAKLFDKSTDVRVTFKDVAGLKEAKEEVEEVVQFLKHPGEYTRLGGKIPKGALLVGPPGTGKTLLAKAVAGEANVPFFSLSGSDFVEMFVGVGASRVRDLFKQAKEKAPCIIFIDEIDAIGRARSKNVNMSSNDERENTLNQLLAEMDGFGSNSGVIVLAATNRADILDKALLRAGRFDRQIYIDLPDLNDRVDIFKVHMKPIKTDGKIDFDFLARQTPGFSGADIANVCNEAALIAARAKKKVVRQIDFMNAIDRIVGGLEKRNKIITQAEKRSIAIHEAGHATLSWFLEYANPLVKVTIVPRGKALGAAWYLPEERQITTKEQMQDDMCATLGGRAAEELFIGQISSGAMNDLEKVTKQAYAMISFFGMGENLPNLSYYDSSGGQDWTFSKPYSEQTAVVIDQEVQRIINDQYARAKLLLQQHKEGHAELAKALIEKEVIYKNDLEEIFGKRKWISRSEEILKENEETEKKAEHEDPSSKNEKKSDASENPEEKSNDNKHNDAPLES